MPVFRVGIVCNDGGGEQRTDCVLLARGLAYGSMGNEPERRHQVSGVTCQHVQRGSTLSEAEGAHAIAWAWWVRIPPLLQFTDVGLNPIAYG